MVELVGVSSSQVGQVIPDFWKNGEVAQSMNYFKQPKLKMESLLLKGLNVKYLEKLLIFNIPLACSCYCTNNCIVVHKLANTAHRYPIPWFRELKSVKHHTPICISSFPYNLPMGLRSIMCRGVLCRRPLSARIGSFLGSGQAYVALSRVR